MGSCCGQKSGQKLQYEVRLNNGEVKIVGSIAEARIVIATGGGGSYKAVPAK
jgi:hypothetical protein